MEAPRKSSSSSKKDKMKKSGVRTKFLIESLRNDYYELRQENEKLREMVKAQLPPHAADAILADCFDSNAPKADANNIDDLAGKMAGTDLDDDDEDY